VLVHDRTRGLRGMSLRGFGDTPLGYRFLHTLELFDDRMLLVDLNRGWLRLAA
jgi:hypothetical protein